MLSGLFYLNALDQSISNSRGSGYYLLLLCFIEIPVFNANSEDPDQICWGGGGGYKKLSEFTLF